jgi:DNA-binding NarL/FixJ family response regulator
MGRRRIVTARATLRRGDAKLRVLIVEDHALIALDLQFMVDDLQGKVVGTAASGEEAVALTNALRPDVVLMDVRLAGAIDGIDAAVAVAEVPGTALVFVTGNTEPTTLTRIRRLGDFPIVAKPVSPLDLLGAIRRACRLDAAAQR